MSGNLGKRISRIERLLAPVHQDELDIEEITRLMNAGRERARRNAQKEAELAERFKQEPTPERAQELQQFQQQLRQKREQAGEWLRSLRPQIEARQRLRRAWKERR